jgi:hypothetical protein
MGHGRNQGEGRGEGVFRGCVGVIVGGVAVYVWVLGVGVGVCELNECEHERALAKPDEVIRCRRETGQSG